MLSVFPSLLSYPFLAYFILRLILSYQFGRIIISRYKKNYNYISFIEFIPFVFVLVGFLTQPALIAIIFFILLEWYLDKKYNLTDSKETQIKITLLFISIALLMLGAGSFAFDMPV